MNGFRLAGVLEGGDDDVGVPVGALVWVGVDVPVLVVVLEAVAEGIDNQDGEFEVEHDSEVVPVGVKALLSVEWRVTVDDLELADDGVHEAEEVAVPEAEEN